MFGKVRFGRSLGAVMIALLALLLVVGGGSALASFIITSNSQVGGNTISGHHPPSGDHANVISGSLAGQDLASGAVSTSRLAAGAVTGGKVAAAIKDGGPNVPSLRTLGTGAQQAMPGNAQLGAILTGNITGASSYSVTYAAPSGITAHSNSTADEQEASFQELSPAVATTIGNLSVQGSAGNVSYTVTLRVNGSDTAVACTVGSGQTTCQHAGTVSVPAGSLLSIKLAFFGGPPANVDFGLTVQLA